MPIQLEVVSPERRAYTDEVDMVIVPGIDGRHDIPTLFDGISPSQKIAVPLKLNSVEKRKKGTLWIRYSVVR